MPDPQWERLKQIFHAALALPPQHRAAYLESACLGDASLRKEVEALLKSHEKTNNFIDTPVYQAAAEMLVRDGELKPDQQIAHYQIISRIGEGGMGVVYLAEDLKLHRRVALKFLSRALTQDQERLRRFEREARAASALNHPNILTIHEIGATEGHPFIATEFIEGQTLRERLHSDIGINEALEIAIQIASALVAAHRVNIVQRDIKPENIMIRHDDGLVKVLDFGLAKVAERESHNSAPHEDNEAGKRSLFQTNAGVVMGTVAYMSPEQARGGPVDARTDIWSLGVVLYEMLTNHLPFIGETAEDVRVAILRDKQSPIPAEIPERLKRIVAKALRKDREDRYQTAREILSDLRELQRELTADGLRQDSMHRVGLNQSTNSVGGLMSVDTMTAGVKAVTSSPTSGAEYIVSEIKRHKRGFLVTAAIGLIVLGGLVYGLIGLWKRQQPTAKFSAQSMKISRLTDSGNATAAAISPDGKYIAYVRENEGKASLWLKQVGQATEREIVSPTEGQIMGPTFTRDGSLIYYTASPALQAGRGVLYKIPTLGGTALKVSDNVNGRVGLSNDGKRLAFIRTIQGAHHVDSLIVANVDGTGEQVLARKEGKAYLDDVPTWSRDGKRIGCGASVGPDFLFESVLVIAVDDAQERWITPHRWSHVSSTMWLNDESGLIVLALENHSSELQLWHISNAGEVRRVTNDLNGYLQGSLSITTDSSSLVAVQKDRSSKIWVAQIGEGEDRAKQLTTGKFDGLNGVAWTPDGKILCVLKTGDDSDIWLMNRDGTERKQLSADSAVKTLPQMSPDGRHIVFDSIQGESNNIWRMDADGSNQKQLTRNAFGDNGPRFTPDGQWVIYWSWTDADSGRIQKVSIDGGDPVALTDYWAILPAISPDGNLIAAGYQDEQQIPQLAIIPSVGGKPIKLLSFPPSVVPFAGFAWTADSSSLVYVQKRNGVSNIWSQPINGNPSPKQLTNFKSELIFSFAVSADGHSLVLARGIQTSDVVLIRDFR